MKYNIFYIDDEPENLRAFKAVFRREYNIFTTDSPERGIEYILNNKVDMIIADQRMPAMTGVEFLQKIHDLLPEKPPCRMIYSGYSQTKNIEEGKHNNWLCLFVPKPCDPVDLKLKIDTAISECSKGL